MDPKKWTHHFQPEPWLQKDASVIKYCWDPRRGHIPNFPPDSQAFSSKNVKKKRLPNEMILPPTNPPVMWLHYKCQVISWYPAETFLAKFRAIRPCERRWSPHLAVWRSSTWWLLFFVFFEPSTFDKKRFLWWKYVEIIGKILWKWSSL